MPEDWWCAVDDCPSDICGGPHVSHFCPNGDLVAQHVDNPTPCPFCGHVEPLRNGGSGANQSDTEPA